MSLLLSKPIAIGRTAEIYSWHEGLVLKLFHTWMTTEDVQYEQRIAHAVQETGLPVPSAGNIIEIEGRLGLEYQMLDGVAMLDMLSRQPWSYPHYARRMAELHAGLHNTTTNANLPYLHHKLESRLRRLDALPEDLRQRLLAELMELPSGDRLCHGDFHPANILITSQGEVVIDWIDASLGNPLADLARSSVLALGAAASSQIPQPARRIIVRLFHAAYLRRYFQLRPGGEKEYRRWLPIVAAARLSENIPELKVWLTGQARKVYDGAAR